MPEEKSKFVYITEYDISIDNGPGINEREFVSSLNDAYGDEITCIVPRPVSPEKHFDERNEHAFAIKQYSLLWYPVYLKNIFSIALKLRRTGRFDILVVRLGQTPLVPLMLSTCFRVPLMLKTLAKYAAFAGFSGKITWKGKLFNAVMFPLFRAAIRKCVVADTVSVAYVKWLNSMFGIPEERLKIIPNGVNINRFMPGSREEKRKKIGLEMFDHLIGFAGSLKDFRNLDMVIRSLKLIKTEGRVGAVFVGDGTYRAELEKIAMEEGVTDRVIFTGQVPYDAVPDYLHACDIAADLTLKTMQIKNGGFDASYSQKIPQYLACGLPVLACDVVDNLFIREAEIGEIVKRGDSEELAKSISRLLNMPEEEKKAIRKRALLYAENEVSSSALASKRYDMWKNAVAGISNN